MSTTIWIRTDHQTDHVNHPFLRSQPNRRPSDLVPAYDRLDCAYAPRQEIWEIVPALVASKKARRLIEDARPGEDELAAERLREQVLNAPGPNKAWPKITTVLSAFREQALTADVAQRLGAALEDVGLIVEPRLDALDSRSGTVCLSLPDSGENADDPIVTAMRVVPGTGVYEDNQSTPRESVLWLDVDVMNTDHSGFAGAIREYCGPRSDELLTDLYLTDATPKVHTYEEDEARAVSAVAMDAQEPEQSDDRTGRAGKLALLPIEIVAGDGWLITAWHRQRILRGIREDIATGVLPTRARRQLRDEVHRRVVEVAPDRRFGSGDLGVFILDEITSTYERARTELSAWLDAWELDFYAWSMDDDPDPDGIDQQTIMNIRSLVAEFKRCIGPLDAPGVRRAISGSTLRQRTLSPVRSTRTSTARLSR